VFGISYMLFYNVEWLQAIVEYQQESFLTWDPLLSPSMGYPLLGDFKESTQEPSVPCNTQPATQSTAFGNLQINKASSSHHSTMTLSRINGMKKDKELISI
jgi:hypothetical protein